MAITFELARSCVWTLVVLLLAIPASAANVRLSWTANSEPNLSRYEVQYGTGSGNYSQQMTVPAGSGDQVSQEITGLTAGTPYYFVVQALDASGGRSPRSAEVSLTPQAGSGVPVLKVLALSTPDDTHLVVLFSTPVDVTTASSAGRYLLDGAIQPGAAVVSADGLRVTLTVPVMVQGSQHVVSVTGVMDRLGNAASLTAGLRVSLGIQLTRIVPVGYDTAYLEVGDPYYLDRPHTITELTGVSAGALWLRTNNSDKAVTSATHLSFTVDRNVVVYVGYDRRARRVPNWLRRGFVPIGPGPVTSDAASPFELWAANYPAGSVVLGGNSAAGAAGAGAHYVVLLKSLSDGALTDLDEDGMADSWEVAHGLNANTIDANGDADGDGDSNYQEFLRDTDPQDGSRLEPVIGNRVPRVVVARQLVVSRGDPVQVTAQLSDPDNDPLTVSWQQLAGPDVTLIGATTEVVGLTPAVEGNVLLQLVVSDGQGGRLAKRVTVAAYDQLAGTLPEVRFGRLPIAGGPLSGAELELLTGTLADPLDLAIAQVGLPVPLPAGLNPQGSAVSFSPAEVLLTQPGRVQVPFGGVSVDPPALYHYDRSGGTWQEVASTRLASTLQAQVERLGIFVVASGDPPSGNNGGPPPVNGGDPSLVNNGNDTGGGCTMSRNGDDGMMLALVLAALLRMVKKRDLTPWRKGPTV